MKDVLNKIHEITKSNPKLKMSLESYFATLNEFLDIENSFYSTYAANFLNKFELLKIAFDIAFTSSINPNKLIDVEIKAVNNVLKKGKKLNSLTIINYSALIDLNENIYKLYKKLIQGFEIDLLQKAAEEKNPDLFNDLTTVKALCLYIDFLEGLKLNLDIQPIEQEPRKYTIEQYSLAYIFDCNSIGESIPYGSKQELEKIGKHRNIGNYSPNTFYKRVTWILRNHELNSKTNLVKIAGEDWKEILFELTKHPEELKKYLQSKQL